MPDDPFTVLGLPVRRDLTDEDVRAAWRRIAAATHPDLADGSDPVRYSAAAAAYDTLRTPFGRGEALADLGLSGTQRSSRAPRHGMVRAWRARPSRAPRHGSVQEGRARPSWALVPPASKRRVLGAGIVAAAAIAVAVAGWTPATVALLAGAATWLLSLHTRRP